MQNLESPVTPLTKEMLASLSYPAFVHRLKKPGLAIMYKLTPQKADCLHMAIGICGEAGELADAIKKWAIYNKDVDRINIVEELGDIKFYIEGMQQALSISDAEIEIHNVTKLSVRYPSTIYRDEDATARADKMPDVTNDLYRAGRKQDDSNG